MQRRMMGWSISCISVLLKCLVPHLNNIVLHYFSRFSYSSKKSWRRDDALWWPLGNLYHPLSFRFCETFPPKSLKSWQKPSSFDPSYGLLLNKTIFVRVVVDVVDDLGWIIFYDLTILNMPRHSQKQLIFTDILQSTKNTFLLILTLSFNFSSAHSSY